MKKFKLLVLLLAVICAFTGACDSPSNSSSYSTPSIGDGYDIITVAQALELCGEEGNVTTERYYLLVTVDTVLDAEWGKMEVSDSTGSIQVYGAYSFDGSLSSF